jgi:hydroxymethylglutaryl-CoA lyase
MPLPSQVRIVEVAPRDGLQNEAGTVSAAIKVELIEKLAAAGLPVVEAGAFVSPEWVPQMADSDVVLGAIVRQAGTVYSVLVPNMKGLERALAAGADEITVFAAATESFSQKNINCSISESLDRFRPVCEGAQSAGVPVRAALSVALGCPYEGAVEPRAVAEVAGELARMGCYEIAVSDTIGVGTPGLARRVVEAVAVDVPVERLALHFHDTYGQALANLHACLELGVATIDSSVAGLGGCPYAPGAAGNVATEDVVYMLHGLGIVTGVDFNAVVAAGQFICAQLSRPPASKAALAHVAQAA